MERGVRGGELAMREPTTHDGPPAACLQLALVPTEAHSLFHHVIMIIGERHFDGTGEDSVIPDQCSWLR